MSQGVEVCVFQTGLLKELVVHSVEGGIAQSGVVAVWKHKVVF